MAKHKHLTKSDRELPEFIRKGMTRRKLKKYGIPAAAAIVGILIGKNLR
jgi:hypothetical protein